MLLEVFEELKVISKSNLQGSERRRRSTLAWVIDDSRIPRTEILYADLQLIAS